MLGSVAKSLFGSAAERAARHMTREIEAIAGFENRIERLSDDEIAAQTELLRKRVAVGDTLDDLLPEAFALVREAARRVLGQRPYDVQMMGGITLHRGRVAEMKTGEGKTLVAVLPAYLNALTGKGVHIVTVNEYLAQRDCQEMGRVFAFLGMSVGCILTAMSDAERRLAYAADVTYGTNSEFGFDYLRDNMKLSRADMVQRPFAYAIVDEVDSILIDEARTPLVISGQGADASAWVNLAESVVATLTDGDWDRDIKQRSVVLTDQGLSRVEQALIAAKVMPEGSQLHDQSYIGLIPFVHQALRAHVLFEKDKDYLVRDDKVVIVDENTGRSMDGRRFSDGLHQALEAKERVTILPENQTTASVTYQNFFRLYPKLSGMTGTAATEATEFGEIYGLDVVQIPTNRPIARIDHEDEIYGTSAERDAAMVELVAEAHARRQPVLVGTSSIDRSEIVSRLLTRRGIPHAVLNARQHEQEARIVAQAGRPGAVTIATNMAGRGTDIKLGGNVEFMLSELLTQDADAAEREEVLAELLPRIEEDARQVRAAGGLFVIGTERHDSRRVDDQLRGRSGRQGDPGASKFLVSLEDDLMRRFGGEKLGGLLKGLGLREGEPITHPWVSRSVRKAQERIEAHNFDIRKNLLKYDDVVNGQRMAFYGQRLAIMEGEDVSQIVDTLREEAIDDLVERTIPANAFHEQWNLAELSGEFHRLFELQPPIADWAAEEGVANTEIAARLKLAIAERLDAMYSGVPPQAVVALERQILLQCLDQGWREHLAALDHVREAIGLRAYAQRNPLHEWHDEAASLYDQMFRRAGEHAIMVLSRVTLMQAPAPMSVPADQTNPEAQPEAEGAERVDEASGDEAAA